MTRSAAWMLVGLLSVPLAAHGQWTQIGPDGGRVLEIVNDPVTVTTSYAWTAGGLYKTTDGGDHWTLLGAELTLRAPAISAANPNVLLLGRHVLVRDQEHEPSLHLPFGLTPVRAVPHRGL